MMRERLRDSLPSGLYIWFMMAVTFAFRTSGSLLVPQSMTSGYVYPKDFVLRAVIEVYSVPWESLWKGYNAAEH